MSAFDPVVKELKQEAAVTARVLERIPEEHLSWKPREKWMSLGQLAMHTTAVCGRSADGSAFD